MVTLSAAQRSLVERPLEQKLFLTGPAGSGKTTAGVERLVRLRAAGVPAEGVLVFVPQRTLARPYLEAPGGPGGAVEVVTIGGLARRAVELFWPLVAEAAGFAHPTSPPSFLTLETAQYHLARVVRPLLDEGAFESVTLERSRLYSQLLDNLNKSAIVGFAHHEVGPRLAAAWGGDEGQKNVYRDVQAGIEGFRRYCLAHNLLDFSLAVEVFSKHLWPHPLYQQYLQRIQHLIADNVEEDAPVTHDLLRAWLPRCRSALIIRDTDAGYRSFLGADPRSAAELADRCEQRVSFREGFVQSPPLRALEAGLTAALQLQKPAPQPDPRPALAFAFRRFQPQMIEWTGEQIDRLVHREGVPPGQIVVLAPFLSDALRFSLLKRLERLAIPAQSHRPSRALRAEPGAGCLLTLAALAHPAWGFVPAAQDVTDALGQAVEGLDRVRAHLLVQALYRVRDGRPVLLPFEQLRAEMQERITYVLGAAYEALRAWLEGGGAKADEALDHWLSRLFGEVLSQPGFGFHRDLDAARTAANLIDSMRKFRWLAEAHPAPDLGREYLQLVQEGVVAAQYLRGWEHQAAEAVLVAPAYTFLLSNRPVEVQFWLNVSSPGWWERLDQPLTHPHVLSRHWPRERVWTDEDEVQANRTALCRLVTGLLRRCRRQVYLGLSELDEQGLEQQGPLLRAFQRLLRSLPQEPEAVHV